MNIKIKVTKEDIQKAVRCSQIECPIANAIRRQLKRPPGSVYANTFRVAVYEPGAVNPLVTWTPTLAAKKFMQDFDEGKKVKPTTFTLREWT